MKDAVRSVSIYAAAGIQIDVSQDADGNLEFEGSDLTASFQKYEYAYAVSAEKVLHLVEQLGGNPEDDVLDLVAAHRDELLHDGEVTWLRRHGVEGDFSSKLHL
jgi:hypothetical protein